MGEGGYEGGGKREIIHLSLHCHRQNDSCIKMGSDESYFNVLLIVRDKVTTETVHRPQLLKRKLSRSRFEPRSLCLPPLRHLYALPLGQPGLLSQGMDIFMLFSAAA